MRYAVILAGGSGTRLWPMSRDRMPKQLIPFIDGKSLLRLAYERLEGLVDDNRRYVCASRSLREHLLRGVPGLHPERIIAEPMGRDTANALAYSCLVLSHVDPDAVVAVFTADHIIRPESEFRETIRKGFQTVEKAPATLVTFGVKPTHPATGYGYLQLGNQRPDGSWAVQRFVEKPDERTAAQYFAAGPDRYLWNSGMFVWKAATFLSNVRRFMPDAASSFDRMSEAWGTQRFAEVVEKEYPSLQKISVDFAVMEPASRIDTATVSAHRLSADWLDVGSWPSYALTRERDHDGNSCESARPLFLGSHDCLVVSDDPSHVVALLGCSDLVVIHAGDATLVCPRDKAEEVKKARAEAVARFGEALG